MTAQRNLAQLFAATSPYTSSGLANQPELGFHQGVITLWSPSTGTNAVSIAGSVITDVHILVTGDSMVLSVGDKVGILRFRSMYFILGRITDPGGFAGFLVPVPMFQMFESVRGSGTASAISQLRVSASTIFTERGIWEGRLCASSPQLRVEGIWGNLSGTQSVTYRIYVGGTLIGSWTTINQLLVGPIDSAGTFNIADRIGQPFVKIEITAQSSVNNADLIACHLLGMYQ